MDEEVKGGLFFTPVCPEMFWSANQCRYLRPTLPLTLSISFLDSSRWYL